MEVLGRTPSDSRETSLLLRLERSVKNRKRLDFTVWPPWLDLLQEGESYTIFDGAILVKVMGVGEFADRVIVIQWSAWDFRMLVQLVEPTDQPWEFTQLAILHTSRASTLDGAWEFLLPYVILANRCAPEQ